MNSMEEQYGFVATFISEVPEDLKCTLCQLVLRQPIQIMKCGHRFCEACFERTKGYSQHMYVVYIFNYLLQTLLMLLILIQTMLQFGNDIEIMFNDCFLVFEALQFVFPDRQHIFV